MREAISMTQCNHLGLGQWGGCCNTLRYIITVYSSHSYIVFEIVGVRVCNVVTIVLLVIFISSEGPWNWGCRYFPMLYSCYDNMTFKVMVLRDRIKKTYTILAISKDILESKIRPCYLGSYLAEALKNDTYNYLSDAIVMWNDNCLHEADLISNLEKNLYSLQIQPKSKMHNILGSLFSLLFERGIFNC